MAYGLKNSCGPKFDGEGDVESFLTSFGYESEMYGWDSAARARVIRYCLEGRALAVYDALEEDKQADIKEIEKELRRKCVQPAEFYLSQFYDCTLQPEDRIGPFCRRLESLVNKGLPGMETSAKHTLLRSRLIKVVPKDVKNFMELLNDRSWPQLVTIFENQKDYNNEDSKNDYLKIDVNKFETPERRDKSYRPNANTNTSASTSYAPSRKRFDGTCFYCGKAGHRKVECRKRERDEEENKTRGGRTQFASQGYNTNRYDSKMTPSMKSQFDRNQRQQDDRRFSKVKSFNIDADESDDDLKLDEFKLNILECENFYFTSKKSSLIRARAIIEVGHNEINTSMLIDCGASSSLINPEVLPRREAEAIEKYLKQGIQPDFIKLRKSTIRMTGAWGQKVAECAIGVLNFVIGDWKGSHEFIFTEIEERAILGMDFLLKHGAMVDMKNRVVKINNGGRELIVYEQKDKEEKSEKAFVMKMDSDLILEPRTENLVKINTR